jgi:uncharacterized phage protein gp47/JayE
MSYFSPFIDSSGLHIPLYSDILSALTTSYKSIYGQDVYLGNDAADYQWISVIADKLNDVMLSIQEDYNNRSPFTAVGVALDGLVKNNGMTRKSATYSTCLVEITGITGTLITNGVVQDLSGYNWSLPSVTTIGTGGTVTVSATCQTIGLITALPNSITKIITPQYGWTAVNNNTAAIIGQPVETDAQLRARQNLSTRLASHTMLTGTIAGIAAVKDVTRYNVHENNTNYNDGKSPPHSIAAVVEGGTDSDVATAIFTNRGLGCDTYGTGTYGVTVAVTDPDTGAIMDISFFRPHYIPIYVEIHVTRLAGYTNSITSQIEQAIVNYLNDLQIGQNLTISGLYGVALAVMPSLTEPMFSITLVGAGTSPGALSGNDITINFDEVTQGISGVSPAYITVVVT